MRVVVTGASGLLGRSVVRTLRERHSVTALALTNPAEGSLSLDIRDATGLDRLFRSGGFEACVHCAAKTRVGDCERDPGAAFMVNCQGTANVAAACRSHGARLVHISTDFVFSGTAPAGYIESALPDPLQVYGRSKLAAEQVAAAEPGAAIVRVGLLYGYNGPCLPGGWPLEVAHAIKGGSTVRTNGFDIRQPTYIDDVAVALRSILERGMHGVFHIGGPTPLTKLAWAQLVADLMRAPRSNIIDDRGNSDGIARPHRAWLLSERADAAPLAPKTDPASGTASVLRAAGILRGAPGEASTAARQAREFSG